MTRPPSMTRPLTALLGRFAVLLFLAAATVGPSAAQAITAPTEGQGSFIEVCADKSTDRGRLRFCDAYFREALGQGADPVLYLRDRITTLRASHEANAVEKYQSFLTAIYISAFLAVATIVLVATERRITGISKWATATIALAFLILVGATAAGWLGKYRAEHAAQTELGLLRDAIEAETAQAISAGRQLTETDIARWTDRLYEIGQRFASAYGTASPLPDFERFGPP